MENKEKVCLQWRDHQKDTTSQFKRFRDSEDFTDVTLVCKDGKKFKAHKLILASSSHFFWTLLTSDQHSHPLIYMRGSRSEDMAALLDFLYHGEAKIFPEDLSSFLALAEELQLDSLNQVKEEVKSNQVTKKSRPTKYKKAKSFTKYKVSHNDMDNQLIEELEKTIAKTKQSEDQELQELDYQIDSMVGFSQVKVFGQGRMRICKVCGKEGQRSNIRDHIEAHHVTGFSHDCGVCGKTSRRDFTIFTHIDKVHPLLSLIFQDKKCKQGSQGNDPQEVFGVERDYLIGILLPQYFHIEKHFVKCLCWCA